MTLIYYEAVRELTLWGLNKMASNLQMQFQINFVERKVWCWFLLKFLSNTPVDIKSALVEVVARHWTVTKQLHEPVMTHFTEACAIKLNVLIFVFKLLPCVKFLLSL